MLNDTDRENVAKASQSATFLVRDLMLLYSSSNPLLSELVNGMIDPIAQVRDQLVRIEAMILASSPV